MSLSNGAKAPTPVSVLRGPMDIGSAFNNRTYELGPDDITASRAIEALIAADGDIALAAERLFGYTKDKVAAAGNVDKVRRAIITDPSAAKQLQEQLRASVQLKLFGVFSKAHEAFVKVMDTLDAKEVARTYKQIAELLTALTDDKTTTQNINVKESLLHQLPPALQQAFLELADTDKFAAEQAQHALQSGGPSYIEGAENIAEGEYSEVPSE